ncbi:MAG: hypothetical protein DRJ35_03775 [Thermoprotei archaeon]|nr:MAG: hypothetical protein DRJ35_03775 [Thermoprotei archaeon]
MEKRLKSYSRLARIDHGVLTAIAVVAGGISSGVMDFTKLFLAVISAFFAEVFLFVTNDILNIEEDRLNSPDRPLVTGEVSFREAWTISAVSLAIAVFLSYFIGFVAFLIMVTVLAIGFVYNWALKKVGFLGNVIVAAVTASSFLYGGAATAGYIGEKIFLYFLIAFTANVGREIVKGIRDIKGDLRAGVRTVAILFGEKSAGLVAAFFMIVAVALSFFGLKYTSKPVIYMALISVTDFLFMYSSAAIVMYPRFEVADKVRKITLLGMGLAIIAFMF